MKTTILIADDEPHIVELVRETLAAEDIVVLEAADGEIALALATAHQPDLVLLDVHMPKIDGFEVCRHLRSDARLRSTKIVMLTAAVRAEDEARGYEAGADRYLTKPFSPLRLLSVVHALVPWSVTWLPR